MVSGQSEQVEHHPHLTPITITANPESEGGHSGTPNGTPRRQTLANSSQRHPMRSEPDVAEQDVTPPNKPGISHYGSSGLEGISVVGGLSYCFRTRLIDPSCPQPTRLCPIAWIRSTLARSNTAARRDWLHSHTIRDAVVKPQAQ